MFGPVPCTFNMYLNDGPQTHGVHLALFADDACLYVTDRKEGLVRKLQRDIRSMKTWCESKNIKINEEKTQGINFFRIRRPPVSHLTMNGRKIPFVNSVKYLSVVFNKKVTWKFHV
jgi:hypothetical protein